jgi:hypothetical protein
VRMPTSRTASTMGRWRIPRWRMRLMVWRKESCGHSEIGFGLMSAEAFDSQGDAVAPRYARAACTAAVNSDMRSGLLMKAAAPNARARL